MQKVNLITFNQPPLLEFFDYQRLHNYLLSYPRLIDWWHYLKSTYLVTTNPYITATDLSNFLLKEYKSLHSLVIEVNLQNHNGLLHPDAWKSINSKLNVRHNLEPLG